ALDELLRTGKTDDLSDDLNKAMVESLRGAVSNEAQGLKKVEDKWNKEQKKVEDRLEEEEKQIQISLRRMKARGVHADAPVSLRPEDEQQEVEADAQGRFSPEQRKVEETLTRGFLASHNEDAEEETDEDVDEIE